MARPLVAGLVALLAACAQTTGVVQDTAPPAESVPATATAPEAAPASEQHESAPVIADDEPILRKPVAQPAPAPVQVPRTVTAQDKAEAQRLATKAIDLLDAGEESAARQELDRALSLDPDNKLASQLMRQITEDPVAVLGTQSFQHRVQANETLSTIARRYLGDVYQFYILARYNDIRVPKQLHAGQVIKIPGRAPPAAPPPEVVAKKPPARGKEAVFVPQPEPVGRSGQADEMVSPGAKAYNQGLVLLKSGDKERAYSAFTQAVLADPQHSQARAQSEQLRQDLVRHHHRLATTAYHRQDMQSAIRHWDRVLELDPNNASAKVHRERAVDLTRRIGAFPKKQ